MSKVIEDYLVKEVKNFLSRYISMIEQSSEKTICQGRIESTFDEKDGCSIFKIQLRMKKSEENVNS